MAWYNEAVFYHIYPLGLTGAPKINEYKLTEHRLNTLLLWIDHIKDLGCNALYIGPLFESVGHGYETTDYKKLDSRLGDNEDLRNFVSKCHENGIKVIFDGVFNHTGRDFFAFKDIQENRENSRFLDWYCNVNFYGNTEYNDGFSYDNWGGYNLLVKLNQRNPEVQDYICDVIKYWVSEFDIDGLRLDAADVLDFDFMHRLRDTANNVKEDFWLMGEVIHGDYSRWVNGSTLHSVTNYALHKGLYSGCNDHNFFEIAHTVKRLLSLGDLDLYNFVDNHDVERIYTKLNNKENFMPVSIMEYTLPGVPSIYYGSEYGIEGHKYRGGSDDEIRPYLNLNELVNNNCTEIVKSLGHLRANNPILSYGQYNELELTNTAYSYERNLDNHKIYVCVTNADEGHNFYFNLDGKYKGLLSGNAYEGNTEIYLGGYSGEVLVPQDIKTIKANLKKEVKKTEVIKKEESLKKEFSDLSNQKSLDDMSIEELQDVVLSKMANNGPINEQMLKSVRENIWKDSLINWIHSFH